MQLQHPVNAAQIRRRDQLGAKRGGEGGDVVWTERRPRGLGRSRWGLKSNPTDQNPRPDARPGLGPRSLQELPALYQRAPNSTAHTDKPYVDARALARASGCLDSRATGLTVDRMSRLGARPRGVANAAMVLGAAAVLGAALASCSRAPGVEAPPPQIVDDPVDSLPPVETSIVESEIRYDLAPALAAIERAVPRRFGDITQKLQAGNNRRASIAFAAERSPFRISVQGRRVTVGGVVEYEGRGWYRPPVGPEVSAACGTSGVPRPRARLQVSSTVSLTPEWSLRSRSEIGVVEPFSDDVRDKCRVTIFRIDVTDRVMRATRSVLEGQLRTLDRAISQAQTRERFERWWRDISKPIPLGDSVWLTINPVGVQLGEVRVDSGAVAASIRLDARPRIATGNRPNDFDLFTPLPRLATGRPVGRGLRVVLEGRLGYDVANDLLRRALVGRRVDRGERRIIMDEVELLGIGAGRVALGVRFSGTVRGMVYLTGTPSYDPVNDQLLVPDLAYDLRTSGLLVRGLTWLKDDAIRDFLRERARFPVEGQLDRLRELAQRGMNRSLAEGVELSATLDRAKTVSVRATTQALFVRAEAEGTARLTIDRAPAVRPGAGSAKSR